jgi:hypothetical protein
MTQTEAVLAMLRERGDDGVTPMEALRTIGTMRLAARISDAKALIAEDEEIVTERVTIDDKTFARYVLRRRAPSGLRQETLW